MVLDASALLAFLHDETGADKVLPMLHNAHVSAVNHSEVLGKLIQRGLEPEHANQALNRLNYQVHPFDHRQALNAAALLPQTRRLGLSLGDRACLALARTRGKPAVTADRAWAELDVDITVRLIR